MIILGDEIESGQIVAVGPGVLRTTTLASGTYLITTDCDCYWAQGGAAVSAGTAVAGSGFMPRGGGLTLSVDSATTGFIAVIAATGTGFMFVQKLAKAIT